MLNMSVIANRCLSKNDNKTITNSVDPDETARTTSRLIWIYTVCKSVWFGLQVWKVTKEDDMKKKKKKWLGTYKGSWW